MKNTLCVNRILSAAVLLLLTKGAAATGTPNLEITGTILSRTCEVATTSLDQTVDIGHFTAGSFTSIGATSAAKKFDIELTGCGSAASGAKLTFSGSSDTDNPALLALSDTSGGGGIADGVAVEVLDNNQQPVGLNTLSTTIFALAPGDISLPFYLRYKSTKSTVKPGNASAVMYFDVQYQ